MKQLKKILYLLVGVLVIGVLVFGCTAVVQFGMLAVSESMGITIQEDTLYHVSGNGGIAITAVVCAIFVSKKKYTQGVERKEKFSIGKAVLLAGLAVSICQVLLNVATACLFAYPFPIETLQLNARNTPVDLVFAILIAPVFEELLCRKSAYCLLRRKFSKIGAILICTVLFAVSHGYQLQGFLSCLGAGLVFVLIYDKTGNVGYSIVAHMICNLFATIMNALEDTGVSIFGKPVQYDWNGYVMFHPVIILAAIAFCTVYYVKVRKDKKDAN